MTPDQTVTTGTQTGTCPDCGGPLNQRIEGFRPITEQERRQLTTAAIRVLGLCRNPACPGRALAFPGQRTA